MLLTNGFDFEGYRITDYLGICSGEAALGTGFLSSFTASLADTLGVNSTNYSSKIKEAKTIALDALISEATRKNANAIIGINYGYIAFSADIIGVSAHGTAVKIEKNTASEAANTELSKEKSQTQYNISIPVMNYYPNLPIRIHTINIVNEKCNIEFVSYGMIISALNTNIVFNDVFQDTYESGNISFSNIQYIKGNKYITEMIALNIPDNKLNTVVSANVKISQYITNSQLISVDESDTNSALSTDELLKHRNSIGSDAVSYYHENTNEWRCVCGFDNPIEIECCGLCGRTAKKSKCQTTIADYVDQIEELKSAREIREFVHELVDKQVCTINENLMAQIDKNVEIEKFYGNKKEKTINEIKKYIEEYL